ncbi:hypothetical protein D3OALGB2SA_1520 [Olavius algarvensis associated proteobacterium Delta 3]|nr:hypothetical protein D3OALGB2SA_1520 [Olavius algarvensis associated proteobacterium Delta 3]
MPAHLRRVNLWRTGCWILGYWMLDAGCWILDELKRLVLKAQS